jgi:hypothetical protein
MSPLPPPFPSSPSFPHNQINLPSPTKTLEENTAKNMTARFPNDLTTCTSCLSAALFLAHPPTANDRNPLGPYGLQATLATQYQLYCENIDEKSSSLFEFMYMGELITREFGSNILVSKVLFFILYSIHYYYLFFFFFFLVGVGGMQKGRKKVGDDDKIGLDVANEW